MAQVILWNCQEIYVNKLRIIVKKDREEIRIFEEVRRSQFSLFYIPATQMNLPRQRIVAFLASIRISPQNYRAKLDICPDFFSLVGYFISRLFDTRVLLEGRKNYWIIRIDNSMKED